MAISRHDRKAVEDFFSAIAPFRAAYSDLTFSYLAVRTADGFLLLKGQVSFYVGPSKIPFTSFASENVRAGHCRLVELAPTPEKLLEIIVAGKICLAEGELLFPPAPSGQHGVYFHPFHQAGLQTQNRLNILGIVGAQNTEINRTLDLDWELRASATPYDGLGELAAEYQIGVIPDSISIEFIAFNVAVFDLSSVVEGTKARLGLRLAKEAKFETAALGYRIMSKGRVSSRGSIPGSRFEWSESPDHRQGWTEIVDVPPAAVVHGIATYAGIAQHHGWALDPNAAQNPLRASYETFDKGLQYMQEVLGREGRTGNARDLETVVGWLIWMLGFGVANLGSTPRTQAAPDLLATTPAGHQAVIEVTTGLLRADNKLANLHERAQAIKRSLVATSNAHTRVLPVIVTSKIRVEIEPELEQAERWGILVITRDDFDRLLTRTLVLPNAEQLFADSEKTIRDARAKHGIE